MPDFWQKNGGQKNGINRLRSISIKVFDFFPSLGRQSRFFACTVSRFLTRGFEFVANPCCSTSQKREDLFNGRLFSVVPIETKEIRK
jgi:hypothetical protein